MKVSELTGAELDYWVAKANGYMAYLAQAGCFLGTEGQPVCFYEPCSDWSQGGPIVEQEKMDFNYMGGGEYEAHIHPAYPSRGKSMLEAGMRCFVASKYKDEVPD